MRITAISRITNTECRPGPDDATPHQEDGEGAGVWRESPGGQLSV